MIKFKQFERMQELRFVTSITITATYGGINRAFKVSLMAPPLVIPTPTKKTGSFALGTNLEWGSRGSSSSLIQYGDLVMGFCEFRNKNAITTSNYTILKISGVSMPTSTVAVKIDFLEDYNVFADIPCRMKLTTTGEIQTIINNDDFQGNGY
jgi:hypothetical protein